MRAEGGFLVSAQQKAGRVERVEVTSTVGGPLRLTCPWDRAVVRRSDGTTREHLPDASGVVEVPTVVGETVGIGSR